LHDSRSIGIMLLVCTVVSLVMANSPWGTWFHHLLETEWEGLHTLHLPHTLHHWINDGLMAVFFFLVGMEIKRELILGELSSVKRAALPIGAAIGGMVFPAVLYMLFNKGTEFVGGWGIPTATDIAFSIGVASMLGNRFSQNLKIFLLALAIIDDLGAILVIALFYGEQINPLPLLGAALVVLLLAYIGHKKKSFGWVQVFLGLLLWYLVYNAGIHATIAGVVFAFTIHSSQCPALELKLHNFAHFLVLPLFALVNTAIVVDESLIRGLATTLGVGIAVGLVVGKPLGIYLFSRFLVRNKLATLPRGVGWKQLIGAGILAGIGFTMSIFLATLAFPNPVFSNVSKIAILLSAIISVGGGIAWFLWFCPETEKPKPEVELEIDE
jgi:NhaA family Na+:H+ antiporter